MFERIIRLLIGICFLAIAYYIIVWVIAAIGIPIPPHVLQILLVIFVLLAILYIYRLFAGSWNFTLFPPDPPK
jgi:hypothetical protein